MLHELRKPLPLYCLGDNFFPAGSCTAYFIEYSRDDDDLWKCCMNEGGAWFSIPNQLIRGRQNKSYGRHKMTDTELEKFFL